ncbi:MAG: YceI family protein [Acidobacteriota bacterium]|nr:YceI family protein [Acidobacteriota bacterium]
MTKLNLLRKYSLLLVLALLALSIASPAMAQEAVLELDPAQTQVSFTLGDVLHTVHGVFKLKHGIVKFDPATGHASGMVVVDATSGDSGSHARDHKMHKDILQSAEYPEITFVPQQVQGQVLPQGDFKVQVLGTFTMHGSSHPLALVIQAHLAGEQLTADTQFTIPYVSWGLKNPSTLFLRVNDTVDIAIHAAGQIKLGTAH